MTEFLDEIKKYVAFQSKLSPKAIDVIVADSEDPIKKLIDFMLASRIEIPELIKVSANYGLSLDYVSEFVTCIENSRVYVTEKVFHLPVDVQSMLESYKGKLQICRDL